MKTLTKRQKDIHGFILKYIEDNGISPTFEEIRRSFKLKAISTVSGHVSTLVQKGYLSKDDGVARSIQARCSIMNAVEIPVLKEVSQEGVLMNAGRFEESVLISQNLVTPTEDFYAIRISSDKFTDNNLCRGDALVVCKKKPMNKTGTIVATVGTRPLLRLYRQNAYNLPKDCTIHGTAVQLIRNFPINLTTDRPSKNSSRIFTTADFFAGIGGIRLGFEKAGFQTVFANDFEPQCKHTYDLNFNTTKLFVEDIQKIKSKELPSFDLLLGGFPCQAFSIAGYRQGFRDKKGRGNLFFEVARILEDKKPLGFLLENVKNLKNHDNGRTYRIIEETLRSLGYHVDSRVLNSMEYGKVPQNRERIYIVGFKDKKVFDRFEFPKPSRLDLNISELLEKDVDKKYYYNGKPLCEKLKDEIREHGKVYQWRRKYVRENKKGVCPTLTANMGTGGHNVPIIKDRRGIRKLTPLECARIQGFPETYKLPKTLADSSLYKQFGNSVTVTVIEAIAQNIKKALSV